MGKKVIVQTGTSTTPVLGKDSSAVITALPPASLAAMQAGCICPGADNRKGAGIPGVGGTQYVVEIACPVHGNRASGLSP